MWSNKRRCSSCTSPSPAYTSSWFTVSLTISDGHVIVEEVRVVVELEVGKVGRGGLGLGGGGGWGSAVCHLGCCYTGFTVREALQLNSLCC